MACFELQWLVMILNTGEKAIDKKNDGWKDG
jgi:hypothetical protein